MNTIDIFDFIADLSVRTHDSDAIPADTWIAIIEQLRESLDLPEPFVNSLYREVFATPTK